jgi:hypothetical protein
MIFSAWGDIRGRIYLLVDYSQKLYQRSSFILVIRRSEMTPSVSLLNDISAPLCTRLIQDYMHMTAVVADMLVNGCYGGK